MKIGFIGLGRMGSHMSRNLATAGHALVVHDVNPEAVAAAEAWGAVPGRNAAEVAGGVEAIFVSVPGPDEDEAVMLGADGVFAGANPGLLVVDTTTVTVPLSRGFAARAAEAGLDFLEAPVSGGPQGADAGTLAVMAGGSEAAFARARPLLDCLGSNVRLIGESGAGTAIKLINQAIYISYMAAFAEGLALGEEVGIPLETLLEVLNASAAGHPMIAQKFDEIRGLRHTGFAIERALLFLDLAQDAFSQTGRATPVIDAASASLRNAAALGLSARDLIVARNDYLAKRPR